MGKKNIRQLFEAMTPEAEQKEKMLHTILEQGKEKEKKIYTFSNRLRPALLAMMLLIALTTTALASTYIGLDEKLLKFLKPMNEEQAEYLANGAYIVDKKIKNKNGTLHIKQVIGDSHLTYILMDFYAPEGTTLDAENYYFNNSSAKIEQYIGVARGIELKFLDDENPNDHKISCIMALSTEYSIAGHKIHLHLSDLEGSVATGTYKTVVQGDWKAEFQLNFKDYATTYDVNEIVKVEGYELLLKTISISPISITLQAEGDSLPQIHKALSPEVYSGEDLYPITIKYNDGTMEAITQSNTMTSARYLDGQLIAIKEFENVINDKEIQSIVFFDKEIFLTKKNN